MSNYTKSTLLISDLKMNTKPYSQIKHIWPPVGRHILARYDDSSVVVYQAFCPEIAKFACENGRFGGPKYSFERMTWIKTNFLWMMYRAGWATKKNQEHILAVTIKRHGFNEILRAANEAKGGDGKDVTTDINNGPDDVRLQWDPDHHPSGAKLTRRAIQLGIRRDILKKFNEEWLIKIQDITEFVHEQYENVKKQDWDNLLVPEERVYVPEDGEICRHIRLDNRTEADENVDQEVMVEGATGGADMISMAGLFQTNEEIRVKVKYDAVICLGGAFNPVHSRHIQVMQEVKTWLAENTLYRVIAGLLAVAPTGYVKNKCKTQKCIKAEHRIELCKLACEQIDWINPDDKPIGSALASGIQFQRKMARHAGTHIIVIVGADRAVNKSGHAKWHKESKGVTTVCVGRVGETESVKKAFEKDIKERKVKNKDFHFIPKELDNVSSTSIRKKLEEIQSVDSLDKRADVVMETVRRGWLCENVARYIIKHYDDLYLA